MPSYWCRTSLSHPLRTFAMDRPRRAPNDRYGWWKADTASSTVSDGLTIACAALAQTSMLRCRLCGGYAEPARCRSVYDRPTIPRRSCVRLAAEDIFGTCAIIIGHTRDVIDPLTAAIPVSLDPAAVAGLAGAR